MRNWLRGFQNWEWWMYPTVAVVLIIASVISYVEIMGYIETLRGMTE